jgi:hypothetical protein
MLVLAPAGFAQPDSAGGPTSRPAGQPVALDEKTADLAHGRRLLEGVRDGAFSFDDPAFYWFCRYVKDHADPAAFTVAEADAAVPWKFLMERPSDYRRQLVVVEGTLLSRPAFTVEGLGREDLGRLYECELGEGGTRAICSVICVESPESLPIRSRVRAKGFFLKYRVFTLQTPGKPADSTNAGAGPLIVARRLEEAPAAAAPVVDWSVWKPGAGTGLVAAIAALAVVWLLLRRAARRPLQGAALRRPPSATHVTPSEGDFDWLTEERGGEGRAADDKAEHDRPG